MPRGVPKLKTCPFCDRGVTVGICKWARYGPVPHPVIQCKCKKCPVQPRVPIINDHLKGLTRLQMRRKVIKDWNTRVGENWRNEIHASDKGMADLIHKLERARKLAVKTKRRVSAVVKKYHTERRPT